MGYLSIVLLASCGGGGSSGGESTAAADAGSGTTASLHSVQSTKLESSAFALSATTSYADTSSDKTSSTPPASGASSSPPSSGGAPQVIEYYGDSTIWGYASFSGSRVATPAPAAFAAALPAAGNYDVRNEGVNASTACKLLNGEDGRHPAWNTLMTNSPASIVILNFAINDEWQVDVPTYQSCLTQLARQAKNHGKKVIFETPNPTRDSGPNGLDVYVNAMKAVAAQEQLPVIDQYQYLTNYLNGQSPLTICPDGLHPTEEVYLMKGRYAASVFANLNW